MQRQIPRGRAFSCTAPTLACPEGRRAPYFSCAQRNLQPPHVEAPPGSIASALIQSTLDLGGGSSIASLTRPLNTTSRGARILEPRQCYALSGAQRDRYGKRHREKSQDSWWNACVSRDTRATPAFVRLA